MQVRYVTPTSVDALLDPGGSAWRRAEVLPLQLVGTPLGLQPTGAIRNSWVDRKIGAVSRVEVAALHDGRHLAFRLEWDDPTENVTLDDNTAFPDAAAVLLPAAPGAMVFTMGAPGAAVNAWYWRADENGSGRNVISEGIGTTRTLDLELVRGRGMWKAGRWHVVIARALRVDTPEPVAQLAAGERSGFGVAVWDGANQERGGIKSFSGEWRDLDLDAASTARR
jgi:DMSO reductase family type II enzyme heme b subunit